MPVASMPALSIARHQGLQTCSQPLTWNCSGMTSGKNLNRLRWPSLTNGDLFFVLAMMSGSSASTWRGPRTASTSANPWAAPLRSTPEPCIEQQPMLVPGLSTVLDAAPGQKPKKRQRGTCPASADRRKGCS